MYQDTHHWVNACSACGARKKPTGVPNGFLQPLLVCEPWEIVSMDFLGPLPSTATGNKYILVFDDQFSKWVEAFATPNATADIVAKYLIVSIIARF